MGIVNLSKGLSGTDIGTSVSLTDSHIFVGNASNVAIDVAMSGDIAISNVGVTTIKSNVALAGSPTTTTQSSTDNSTKIATTAMVQAAIADAVAGGSSFRGSYDASSNLFPSTGGSGSAGAILSGDFWVISVAGTLGGVPVGIGTFIYAITDNPGQTAANWQIVATNFIIAPASSTDSAIIAFNGTTGKLAKNTGVTLSGASSDHINAAGLTLSDLTATRAIVTDGSKNLVSLQYTNTNTASTIVSRDASGDFSAGIITAALVGNSSTATALQNARNIGGTSFDGTANIVPQTIQTADESLDTTCFPLFGTSSGAVTSGQQPKTNSGLTYNSSTNALAASSFTGALSGNATTATTLATPRAIYGNNFDGSAALTQVIASTYGGTGNGFTKFSGPTTAEKTFTLPDASATILYSGGALGTPASGTATNITGLPEGGLSLTDITTNDVSITKHGFAPKLPNDATKYLDGTGAYSVPPSTLPSGSVVQVVNTQTGAVATGTTTIPLDDTKPQNTEGNEYMTLAVTPTNAANILYIDVFFLFSISSPTTGIAALFQDSGADALAAAPEFIASSTGTGIISFCHKMTAGTTSSTTFKVRAGGQTGTMTFNGASGARYFGGVSASSITITEVKV